jgi:hypothetical protein
MNVLISLFKRFILEKFSTFEIFQGKNPLSNLKNVIEFVNKNASFVSQVTLYPYIKTRAGTQHPKLFENQKFLTSLRISRWYIFMACVNDMSIFISHLCSKEQNYNKKFSLKLASLISSEVFKKIEQTDIDDEEFKKSIKFLIRYYNDSKLRKNKATETFFRRSADELVKWVPVSEEFKKQDQIILRNSIKFRWIPIRKQIMKNLDIKKINYEYKSYLKL